MILCWLLLIAPIIADENIEGCGCGSDKTNRGAALLTAVGSSEHQNILEFEEKSNLYIRELNSKMVLINGGSGVIGTDKPILKGDGESPLRKVVLSPFHMDLFEVSNEGWFA